MQDLLNEREAAKFLGVSHPTVNRWRRAGKLPPPIREPGKAVRWKREDLERWREDAYREPDEETARRSHTAVGQLAELLRSGKISADHARSAFDASLKSDVARRLDQNNSTILELVISCVASGSTRRLSKIANTVLRDDLKRLVAHYISIFAGVSKAMVEATDAQEFRTDYIRGTVSLLRDRGASVDDALDVAITSFMSEVERVLKGSPAAELRMTKEKLDELGPPKTTDNIDTMFRSLPVVIQTKLQPSFDAYNEFIASIRETYTGD